MEEMNYLFNTEYIGTNIVSFFIFSLYIYTVLQLFSKETLEFKNKEEIEIKKIYYFFVFIKKYKSITDSKNKLCSNRNNIF